MSPETKPNSRNQTRITTRFSCLRELSVTYEGHSEDVITRPPDISTEGMFFNTNRMFPEGAVLNVRFRLASVKPVFRSIFVRRADAKDPFTSA